MAFSDQQEFWRSRLADVANPSLERVGERLTEVFAVEDQDIRDERVRCMLAHLCLRMFAAGVDAGVSEILAQGIEGGLDLRVNRDGLLFPDDGPLNDDWAWDD